MKTSEEAFKGFLITCDKNREREAVKDAYNFLEEYIQKVYSDVTEENILKKLKGEGKTVNLETELKCRKSAEHRLLSQVETNVNCLCFIKLNPIYKQIDPLAVVAEIMKDVYVEKRLVTRYCHRILPVERAFRAQHFRMLQELDELLYIHGQAGQIKSWMLNFKCRNNNKFNYKEVLRQVEKLTKKYQHFPDIYYPQWTISIEINNHLMCLSICENFKEMNEFKLHSNQKQAKQQDPKIELEQKRNLKGIHQKQKQQQGKKQQNKKEAQRVLKIELKKEEVNQGQEEKEQEREQLLKQHFKEGEEDIDLL